MGKQRRKKADHQADTRGKPWAGIPHIVLESAAYKTLSLPARAVLIEIVLKFSGYNNGSIAISQRQIGDRLGFQNWTKISRSIAELIAHGLIDISCEGVLETRRARQYRLTFISTTDGRGRMIRATNEYLSWRE